MTQETKRHCPSAREIAEIYRENAFQVINFDEGTAGPRSLRIIRVGGNYPDEGYRAARFALELDLYLFYLRRVWNYDGRQDDFTY